MGIACEPNSGITTESKPANHPVPLVVDIPEMYGMVSSRPVSMRTLHIRTSEVKVPG